MASAEKGVLLITPKMIKPSSKKLQVIGTINPAAIRGEDGRIVLYVRVIEQIIKLEDEKYYYCPKMVGKKEYKLKIDRFGKENVKTNSEFDIVFNDGTKRLTFISHLRKVILDESGLNVLSIDKKPSFYGIVSDSELGVEDPRIVKIDGQYIMTYVSLSLEGNISTSLAVSKDLEEWERKGIIFGEQDKDVVIFPEKIKGRYVALDRPESNFQFSPPHIWIAYSKDLQSWGKLKSMEIPRRGGKFYWRMGSGCPPIKTEKGWLLIYHAVKNEGKIFVYFGSAVLLDLKNPKKIKYKSREPFLLPKNSYELKLYQKKRIVFPTGVVLDKEKKNLLIYYGGGDVVTAVRKIPLKKIMDSFRRIK
jgi:predicted GH43/DUF377 family glycosyl hydrolase